jgi:hypothetical protein
MIAVDEHRVENFTAEIEGGLAHGILERESGGAPGRERETTGKDRTVTARNSGLRRCR